MIKTSQEYLPALETILKGAAQHIVVDHSDTAVKAINFLKSNDDGRATFIPLSTIKSKFVRDDYLLVIRNNPGFVGIASELVTVAEEYRVLNEFLLGNVIVVSDIKTANEISTIMDKKYMVVTLDGDIIRVGGIMVGGTKEASENILGLDDKIRENEEFLPGLSAMIEKLKSNVSKENQELMLKEQRQKNKEVVIKTLSSKIFDIKSQINKHKTDIDFSNNALDMTDDLTKLNETEKTISQKRSELAILDFDLTTAIEQKDSLDADIQVLNKKNNEQNGMLSQLLSSFTNKTNANEKAKASLAVDKERLTSYYGLTLENAKA
ncbi:hypothetical protein NW070_03345 [Mycoplasmopsis cynos]|nr:hypothetical protein [Mycoplasmopsis cynos]UWV77889.1 hypothetical protein NW070_03345 [Mycoplasmopsis cynos]